MKFAIEIKSPEQYFRFKILEVLWNIIYPDGISNMYESTLMRKFNRLIYVSDKETEDIKQSIIKNKRWDFESSTCRHVTSYW